MARTVLLIDYYPRSISRIRNLLLSSGYRIVVAHDAEEGVKEFRESAPDLTLIQDLLPKGHGYEVCRELKDSEHGQRSPVILLTAPRSGGRRHELLATRCDDFVEKPFTDEGLLAAVRKILPVAETARVIRAAGAASPAVQPSSPLTASAAAPTTAVPIPVELTPDDIGAALDMILPGPQKKKTEQAVAAPAVVANEPKNGKQLSLKGILRRKRKPKDKPEAAAKSTRVARRKRKARSRKASSKKKSGARASGKKVPAPA